MDIKVKSSYLKISPRKLRPTLYGLRGSNAEKSLSALNFTNKKGSKFAAALLKSAIAIGKENDLELNNLYIKSIFCGEGPRLKRRQPKARGRSDAIVKRMSHITLEISDTAEVKEEKKDIQITKKQETSNKQISNSK